MNRDYFTRPNQSGGRSSYDYGRTAIVNPSDGVRWWGWAGMGLALGLVVVWGIAG